MAIDIENFKKKFESKLKKAGETITPISKELKKEFSKLEVNLLEKGSYQEQVTQKEQQPSSRGHFRAK